MWTPFLGVVEEGSVPQTLPEVVVGPRPPEMPPLWFYILGCMFEGKKPKQIAKDLAVGYQTVAGIVRDPTFQAWVERAEAGIVDKIQRGEFGAMAVAKAEAVGAMRRIVGLSREADKDAVKLQANLEVLKYAGILPAKQLETPSVERLVDLMTAEEQELFARDGSLPERLHDQVARLSANVIRAAEASRWQAEVVDGFVQPEERPAPEVLLREEMAPERAAEDVDEGDVEGAYRDVAPE